MSILEHRRPQAARVLLMALTTSALGGPLPACDTPHQRDAEPTAATLVTTNPDAAYLSWRDSLVPNQRGMIYVEGDLPLFGEEDLRSYYDSRFGNPQALTAYKLDDGTMSKWSLQDQHNLTYCLDYRFDWPNPEYRQIVEDALDEAAEAWESATDVDFRHVPEEDGWGCNSNNNAVVFHVTIGDVDGGRAEAFRPHHPRDQRIVTISETGIVNDIQFKDPSDGIAGRSLGALLAHELGHVLGFDHEHVWSWDEECADWNWDTRVQLTPADTASVMWYPGNCESTHPGDYAVTDYDRLGAMCHYTRNLSPAACGAAHTGADSFWWSNGVDHATTSLSVNSLSLPLTGDFDGDGRGDILWYGRGGATDTVWWGGLVWFTFGQVTINGAYDPFVGDYNCDGRDDIFWYAPGPAQDWIWYGRADRGFDGQKRTVNGIYQPIPGDFDGDGCGDVLWYRPGSDTDAMWYFAANKTHDDYEVTIDGTYRVASGDFDGDGRSDIVWHQAGAPGDAVWWGRAQRGSFTKQSKTVNGDYHPFAADLDGDGRDEVFWYGSGYKADVVWDFSAQRTVSSRWETVNGLYSPVTGDFDGDGDDDIFWFAPL